MAFKHLLKNFLKKWVLNCIKKFNIKDIILSGGVAQNIKAIKFLQDDKKIDSVWSGPKRRWFLSLGVWLAAQKFDKNNSIKGLKIYI